jgi:hypothetical protein
LPFTNWFPIVGEKEKKSPNVIPNATTLPFGVKATN